MHSIFAYGGKNVKKNEKNSQHLQNEALEILRFFFVQKRRVIGRLRADFHGSHPPPAFLRGFGQHFFKEGEGHVMGTGTGD